MIKALSVVIVILALFSCSGNENFVPKPHGYPRLELPTKKYVKFDTLNCPYSFEFPTYANILQDTHDMQNFHPNWYNVNFKDLNATLHLTYYRFSNFDLLDSLIFDSRKLVNKHIQRADDIVEESVADINPKMHGVIFSIQGNTATNYNFYVTDSARHFLRGALYFNGHTVQDSIAPAFNFVKKDVEHLIHTLYWK